MDWPDIVFQPSWLKNLSKLAFDRFKNQTISEEAATYVIEHLSADSWARLKDYSGLVKPETFLRSVSVNLIEEFARKKFGRIRPPTWLIREGDIWLRVWKMLCLERQDKTEVLDKLCLHEQRDPLFVSAIIKTIQSRIPWCGVKTVNQSIEDMVQEPELLTTSIEVNLEQQTLETSLLVIKQLLENWDCPSKYTLEDASLNDAISFGVLTTISERLDLDELEKLVLKMAFQEGLKLKLIAKALNMPDYQPGRILKKTFENLSLVLQDEIPMFRDLKEILQN